MSLIKIPIGNYNYFNTLLLYDIIIIFIVNNPEKKTKKKSRGSTIKVEIIKGSTDKK